MAAFAQAASDRQSPPTHHHPADDSALFPLREASGTAWLPDETPMYGLHRRLGSWQAVVHGAVFGQFLYEPGDKHRTGGPANTQFSSVNWLMGIARRPAGSGRVGVRAMVSAEPWTVQDCGFINLLANGEMCEGDTIHDRQHPHDLVMELAADYDRPVKGTLRWQLYGGIAGEPALGPVSFPHRVSAAGNPVAPIGHHWLDSTHITFGLITAGVYSTGWKGEMSVFNAREPDQERNDIDFGPLDSLSGRVSVMPTRRLALQVSAGHLREAEAEFPPQPRGDVDRATASATYHRMSPNLTWATTLAYGVNAARELIPGDEVHLVTHALMLESSLSMRERDTWFGRIEVVGKPGHDLHVHEAPATVFTVAKLQGGYVRYFAAMKGLVPGVGATAAVSVVPMELASRYSGRIAPGFGLFVTLRPGRHAM